MSVGGKKFIIFPVVLAILVISLLFIKSQNLFGNTTPSNHPKFSYSVSGCEEKVKARSSAGNYGKPEFSVRGSKIKFTHNLHYVCCAELKLGWSQADNRINITEVNTGRMCRCICKYNVNASLGPLPEGNYTVGVYGVKDGAVQPDLLLKEGVVI